MLKTIFDKIINWSNQPRIYPFVLGDFGYPCKLRAFDAYTCAFLCHIQKFCSKNILTRVNTKNPVFNEDGDVDILLSNISISEIMKNKDILDDGIVRRGDSVVWVPNYKVDVHPNVYESIKMEVF